MTIALRTKSMLPSMMTDFFENDRLFDSDVFNLEKNLLRLWDIDSRIPSANIIENTKDYKVELAAPGLEKKDFKIEVDNKTLTISAEKKEEKKEEHESYKRREFAYNAFSRTFTLPENVLADKIDAKYENGVLLLSIPKKEVTVAKPKKEIKVS